MNTFKVSSMFIVGSGITSYCLFIFGGETIYKKGFIPLVHKYTDGEDAHKWAIKMVKWGLLPRFGPNHAQYPELECTLFGYNLKNPIGLAAGFDKDGECVSQLARSGFGMVILLIDWHFNTVIHIWVEIGSVTPLPQPGNNRPRVFRLIEDKGIINRYGFNSIGVGAVQSKIKCARLKWDEDCALFGVNLGKNKNSDEPKYDYEVGVHNLGPYCDYLVVNVSSPNTPGLRSMQNKRTLKDLLKTVRHSIDLLSIDKKPALVLKIAPDLVESEMIDIADVVMDKKYGIDGIIVSNTTVARPDSLKSDKKDEKGGLSGAPLKEMSTECIRKMYKFTKGTVTIIGVGGISSGSDAYEKIRAGASAVQIYSALVYQGWPLIGKIKRELVECLQRDGYSNITQAIGVDHTTK